MRRFRKRDARHRVEHAFAELVGHPVVEPHHRDPARRHLLPEPHLEPGGTVESAKRAADTHDGAAGRLRFMRVLRLVED